MKRLLLIAAAALIATKAGAQIDEKKAEEAHQAKKQYAECLARETAPLLDRKYSEATIALMAQEMCPAQAQQFLKSVMDYLAARIPQTASGDHVGKVRVWATTSATASETPKVFNGQWDRITQLVFTSDDRWLVSGSADSTVRLWNLGANDCKTPPLAFRVKQQRLVSLAVSDDGCWLAAASTGMTTGDNSVRIWDLHAKDINASAVDLSSYKGRVHALAISRDGQWVATGDDTETRLCSWLP